MRWNEVEREFVILGAQFEKLATSFRALAGALHREREFGTQVVTERDDPPSEQQKTGVELDQVELPLSPEDPFA